LVAQLIQERLNLAIVFKLVKEVHHIIITEKWTNSEYLATVLNGDEYGNYMQREQKDKNK
jgi:hypothetical protein